MDRNEILKQAKEGFGLVPDWLSGMPDGVLQQYWATLGWVTSDSGLKERDKILIAYGAAAALHCEY
jgi:hypothetical protein